MILLVQSIALFLLPALAAPAPPTDINWAAIRCPSNNLTTFTTPTYAPELPLFSVCTETTIRAPASAIYRALLDFQSYPLWNSFVVDITLPDDVRNTPEDVYVGLHTRFTTSGIIPGVNTTSVEVVTVMGGEEGADVRGYMLAAWRYDDSLGGVLLRAEHPTTVIDQGDGRALCVSWESFYTGAGTLGLALFKETLQRNFDGQGLELKRYLEGEH